MQSAPLLLQALEQSKSYRTYTDGGRVETRAELDRPIRYVATVTPLPGRFEVTVKPVNVQRIVDNADINRPKRYRATTREEMQEGSAQRSGARARKAVRLLVQRLQADRMLTFGTRAKLPLDVLLIRFRRFVEFYKRHTGLQFKYVAVPELHQSGDHWHIHCATNAFVDLRIALPIWWSLCRRDDIKERNGSINVKRFVTRYQEDDPVGTVAGYIAKYLSKNQDATEVNRKKYWSSRIPAEVIHRRILNAETLEQAFEEVREGYGLEVMDIILMHQGCFFVFPDDRGFWLRVKPTMKCSPPF